MTHSGGTPSVSMVVVAHDMGRELPRTLASLDPTYQQGIDASAYEVVVVDNGSPTPVRRDEIDFHGQLSVARVDPAPPSPAGAANLGLRLARADLVGLIVDGARMASPGLLATALVGASTDPRALVVTAGWHLGAVRHNEVTGSYDQAAEDALLDGVGRRRDGYRLFEVSTFAASSGRGWFGPIGESSAVFMRRALWDELGGLDEAFDLPGGGLVNHDLLRRATELAGVQPVMLLGEGTFHQYHGGAATSGATSWEVMDADYAARRGGPYRPPDLQPLFVGHVPPTTLGHLEQSVALARRRQSRAAARRSPAGGSSTDL